MGNSMNTKKKVTVLAEEYLELEKTNLFNDVYDRAMMSRFCTK